MSETSTPLRVNGPRFKRIARRGEVQRECVEVLVRVVGGQVHPGDLADDVIVLVRRDVGAGDVRDGQRARLVLIRRARHSEHVAAVGNGAAGATARAIRDAGESAVADETHEGCICR